MTEHASARRKRTPAAPAFEEQNDLLRSPAASAVAAEPGYSAAPSHHLANISIFSEAGGETGLRRKEGAFRERSSADGTDTLQFGAYSIDPYQVTTGENGFTNQKLGNAFSVVRGRTDNLPDWLPEWLRPDSVELSLLNSSLKGSVETQGTSEASIDGSIISGAANYGTLDPTSIDDTIARFGLSWGAGLGGRFHNRDDDGDGISEVGLGVDLGPLSIDIRSEDTDALMDRMPVFGVAGRVADSATGGILRTGQAAESLGEKAGGKISQTGQAAKEALLQMNLVKRIRERAAGR